MLLAGFLAFPLVAEAQAVPEQLEVKAGLVDTFGKGSGLVTLTQMPRGLLVRIESTGLPEGWHGAALHAHADCSDHMNGFANAGLILANMGEEHGYGNIKGPKSGALPNIWVHGDGTARVALYTNTISLNTLLDQDGSALVLYAGPDDYASQPNGNLGARVGCARIVK